jgi:hypothetical protein
MQLPFIELYFNFMYVFCISLSSRGRLLFLCPASCPSCATLSRAGLLEVPASYLGHLVIFLLGSRVAEWLPLGKANANGGSKVCSLLSLVPYPKRVHFAFLKLSTEYWGLDGARP